MDYGQKLLLLDQGEGQTQGRGRSWMEAQGLSQSVSEPGQAAEKPPEAILDEMARIEVQAKGITITFANITDRLKAASRYVG